MRHLARLLTIASTLAFLVAQPATRQVHAETKLELSVDSPRRAVYRGETLPIVVRWKNLSAKPVPRATVTLDVGGVRTGSRTARSLGPEQRWSGTFRIPTRAIHSGDYELSATLTCPGAEN